MLFPLALAFPLLILPRFVSGVLVLDSAKALLTWGAESGNCHIF